MLVEETYINATEGHRIGWSGLYEPYTDNIGELYRTYQKEYGRCVSKVYVDPPGGGQPIAVGWVFQGRDKYQDDPTDSYLREVWITLHEERPTVTTEHHYHEIG